PRQGAPRTDPGLRRPRLRPSSSGNRGARVASGYGSAEILYRRVCTSWYPSEVKVAIPRRVPRDFLRPAWMQIRFRPASSDRLGFDSSVAKCFREVVHKEGGRPCPLAQGGQGPRPAPVAAWPRTPIILAVPGLGPAGTNLDPGRAHGLS